MPIGNISHRFTNLQQPKLFVKKDRFKEIARNYSSKSEEINSLKELANKYPFSQIVHLLLANASKKDNSNEYKSNLSNAAFYSTDRSILKSLIENNLVPSEKLAIPNDRPSSKKTAVSKEQINKRTIDVPSLNTDDLIAQVLDNVNKLQKVKKEFANSFIEIKPNTSTIVKPTTTEKITSKAKASKELVQKKTIVKKQTNLIEKFIKEKPSITKNSKSVNEKDDLSKDSIKMRDDVISESLAKIFANQGKTQKAIDIYKKLIWKLPQKKSLFAAEIEKLKKN